MRLLLELAGCEVVGEAGDVEGAVRMASDLAPEAMLLDVHLPDGTGFDICRTVGEWLNPPLCVLTSTVDYSESLPADRRGAFIAKDRLSGDAFLAAVEKLS
jgi:DNA-binding NarL/FixJ family response regulator